MQKKTINSDVESVLVINKLFFGNKSPLFKKNPYTFWFLIGATCLGTSACLFLSTKAAVFIRTALPLSIGIILVPFGIKLGAQVLNKWGVDVGNFTDHSFREVRDWFTNEVIVFSGTRSMINCGLMAGIVSTSVFGLGGAFENLETIPRFGLAFIILTAGFFAWIGIFSVFCMSRMIWRFGRFNLKVEKDPFGVMTTGKTLVKCYYIAAVIWCFFTSSATVGMSAGWIPMILLAVPSIIFFFFSFVTCQIPMHNKMIFWKRAELLKIKQTLNSLAPKNADDLTDTRKQQIEFFEKRFADVIALPEWPFDWKSMLGALISGLASVFPTLLDLSIETIKSASNGTSHSF